jgi:hypothetical protein
VDAVVTARLLGSLRVTLEQVGGVDELEPSRKNTLDLVGRAIAGDRGAVVPALRGAAAVLAAVADLEAAL